MGTEGLNTLGTHKLTKPNLAVKTIDTMKTKNIYLLPTDKPSRLFFNNNRWSKKFEVTKGGNFINGFTNTQNHHIYITSYEEIKVEDWCLLQKEGKNYVYKCTEKPQNPKHWGLEIILTTDPDLIKDGVQAISDEFLEWFVKNPSCEQVEIRYTVDFNSKAVIVIPKEEPNDFGDIVNEHFWGLIEIKQETLEEAAERYEETDFNVTPTVETSQSMIQRAFINGAKEQAERMYSEEEIINILVAELKNVWNITEWFEQFKKT